MAADLADYATGRGDDLSLYLSGGPADAMRPVVARLQPWLAADDIGMFATVIDGTGPGVAPAWMDWFDNGYAGAAAKQRMLSAVALLPTDEAMQLLVDRLDVKYVQAAFLDAAKRFPVRATRLLATHASRRSATGRIAEEMLRAHALTHTAAAQEAMSLIDDAGRALIEVLLDDSRAEPAGAEQMPAILVSPPWLARNRVKPPSAIEGLTRPDECEIRWSDGERESALAGGVGSIDHWKPRSYRTWAEAAGLARAGKLGGYEEVMFFAQGDLDLTTPFIGDWTPGDVWDHEHWLATIIARYGLAAHPAAVRYARRKAAATVPLLMPYASSDIALLMADWSVRLKSVRKPAATWLLRHSDVAARALIPDAVGKAGSARRAAEQALRILATGGHIDAVTTAAKAYGPETATAIDTVISADPLQAVPTKMPALPAWADAALMPAIRLSDRSAALPREAVGHVTAMLSISRPDEPYAGIAVVAQACDPDDLAAYVWVLFTSWRAAGFSAKEGWVLASLGLFGNDETVRRLSPLIRVWPGEGGHARAVAGLDVLAQIGTDVALMHLYRISQKVKFKALKDRATEKIAEVADNLQLTSDELSDRLVPDLGLDGDGRMVLDYGPRTFTVGFDEQLKPYVRDEAGRRKTLPKPGAKDDPEVAAASYLRFTALKKDVRTLATDQIDRLEAAMVSGRRWSATDFRGLLVGHPLLSHIVRRLVWATFDDDGTARPFRVAEDRTFADVDDATLSLSDDAIVGVAHPLHLGSGVAAWSDVFADYEILQPFTQLGRSVHTLTDTERQASTLERFAGVEYETVRILGLESRGWRRGAAQDGGVQGWMYRPDRRQPLDRHRPRSRYSGRLRGYVGQPTYSACPDHRPAGRRLVVQQHAHARAARRGYRLGDAARPDRGGRMNLAGDVTAAPIQRPPAEIRYADELARLRTQDTGDRPPGWSMSLQSARRFILGDDKAGVSRKFVGDASLIDRSLVTLATGRGLMLVGEPGTAKSMLSELLAAAVSGESTLTIQGGAATTEDQIRYSWNYALLVSDGPSMRSLVPAPLLRGMANGRVVRFEEITRCPLEVQDCLLAPLSDRVLAVPELSGDEALVFARDGFNIIATANTRDRGVNEMSAALKRRFNFETVFPIPDFATELTLVETESRALLDRSGVEAPQRSDVLEVLVTVFRELRTGQTERGDTMDRISGVMSTAEAVSVAHAIGLRGWFLRRESGDAADIVACLAGTAAKDNPEDLARLRHYLEQQTTWRRDKTWHAPA